MVAARAAQEDRAAPADASGFADFRRGDGRCNGADAPDGQRPSRFSQRAAVGRRRGNQSRRCPARAGEDAGSLQRTSAHRLRRHQPDLHGGAAFDGCDPAKAVEWHTLRLKGNSTV